MPSLMPLTDPPEDTMIVPPEFTVSAIAEVTCATPPLAGQLTTVKDANGATVSDTPAPLTVPPLATRLAPEAKVTFERAPLAPNEMVPPLLTVPLVSVPPDETISSPPDRIVPLMSAVAADPPESRPAEEAIAAGEGSAFCPS